MPRPTTPKERQAHATFLTGYGAVRLRREGDYAIVELERKEGDFVAVIKEHLDSNFCHVIEPIGILKVFAATEVCK